MSPPKLIRSKLLFRAMMVSSRPSTLLRTVAQKSVVKDEVKLVDRVWAHDIKYPEKRTF